MTPQRFTIIAKDKTLTEVCGNNKIEGNEQCDDGNKNNGDGCSSLCMIETTKPFFKITSPN